MKVNDIIREGGWDTTVTQGTIIRPAVVKIALNVVQQFVDDFNKFLTHKNLGPVEMGRPTGSSAYHERDQQDDPEKIYGDIDLQMIGPEFENLSQGQFTDAWNKLANEFVKQTAPSYVHSEESKPGHPIIQIGPDAFVQVDFMWHPERLRDWGAARVTPEHKVKGLLTGNMFSVLGELLDMSIQHAGVQIKLANGNHVPFSKQKDTKTVTLTHDPKHFIYHIFKHEYQDIVGQPVDKTTRIDPLLLKFPGNDVNDVKISKLVQGIKGLANSFEVNDMYGKGDLAKFNSADSFLQRFLQRYTEKAMVDINAAKRDKATTPEAIARAEDDKKKVMQGLEMVTSYFK